MTTQTNAGETKGETAQKVEIAPLPYALGAEVWCGDVRTLNEQDTRTIYQAYLDHMVLLFRNQKLSDYELMDFGRRFGQLDEPISSEYRAEGVKVTEENMKYISVISNVKENGVAIGALGDGEAAWHSDFSFHEVPYSATLLYALEVPPRGGNTGFLNMYLALEMLPPDLRDKIRDRTIKHDASHNSTGQIRRGFKPVTDIRTSPGPSHPIVWRHPETGHDALYLGRRPYAYVNGLPLEESEVLLDALWAHATQPCFGWHHTWKVGDILVWDNRCTMHHRDPFDPDSRRVMHKTACRGTRPTKAQYTTIAPHPRGYMFS